MTHPVRATEAVGALSVAEARRRITYRQMTEMCLAVNMQMGSAAANKLLDLFVAAAKADDRMEPS